MSEYGYRVIYVQLAEGGFQVIVPALSRYGLNAAINA